MARKRMAIKSRNNLSSNIHPSFKRKSSLIAIKQTSPGFESLPSGYYNQTTNFDHFSEIYSLSDEENDANDCHAGDLATSIAVNIFGKTILSAFGRKAIFEIYLNPNNKSQLNGNSTWFR